jgi:2-keto-4-pentenoate hydratase/2-oxohepta-3-ene-1,7-dioic acid hydratase in catechol pathway
MNLIRFQCESNTAPSWGMQTSAGVLDFGMLPEFRDMSILQVIRDWAELESKLTALMPAMSPLSVPCHLLAPLPEGGKLICIGLNYRDHAIESGMEIPSEPVVFNKLAGTLCGPGAVVPLPPCSQQVDYEAELVIVIGRRTSQVSESDAEHHIFGYTCGHDVSARDWQLGRPGGQWLLGKSFPNFAPLGPCIVPKEQIGDVGNLRIALRINGVTFQDSSTKQLIYSPQQLVSFLSKVCVLEPGDIIFTGTPPGVGMARQPQRFLQDGDECEVEIEGIGKLTNRFERQAV